jgi:hypothetical protein
MRLPLTAISVLLSPLVNAGDISVSLETPTGRILRDETQAGLKVTVSNGTMTSVHVFKNAHDAVNKQLFWCIAPESKMAEYLDTGVYEQTLIGPNTRYWTAIEQNYFSASPAIAPGEKHTWDFDDFLPLPLLSLIEHEQEIQLYAKVVVGSGQFICSNTNLVRFTNKSLADALVVFEGGFGTPVVPFKVHALILDNGKILLGSNGSRFCSVPTNAVPSFFVNTNAAILTITFSTGEPQVIYDLKADAHIP